MKNIKITVVISFVLILTSCAELMQIAQETAGGNKQLTQTEIIAGLKEALIIGTNQAVDVLGVTDGYYMDRTVKILLPPEANVILENIGKVPGGQALVDDVLLSINRAAEDAVSEAAPIFVSSIKSMTIDDAVGILQGKNDAATSYLRRTTCNQLFELYLPKIKTSLDKKLVGNVSPSQSWNALTEQWNIMANSVVGQVAGLEPVNINLEAYLTREALDGLYVKIENEEQRIRENPAARVTDLLKRVFGSVDAS